VRELEALGVDPCGEYGEYHTLVTNTPLFDAPLDVTFGAREMHSECWALDVVSRPAEAGPYASPYVGAACRRPGENAPR
jgi:diphthamide synthase (EF-2-diphthine--ammonia ligase)